MRRPIIIFTHYTTISLHRSIEASPKRLHRDCTCDIPLERVLPVPGLGPGICMLSSKAQFTGPWRGRRSHSERCTTVCLLNCTLMRLFCPLNVTGKRLHVTEREIVNTKRNICLHRVCYAYGVTPTIRFTYFV